MVLEMHQTIVTSTSTPHPNLTVMSFGLKAKNGIFTVLEGFKMLHQITVQCDYIVEKSSQKESSRLNHTKVKYYQNKIL